MKLTDIILEKINGGGQYDPVIDFDVKGINITYTDYGRFYGIYLYDVPATANTSWREKLRSFDDASEYIKDLTGLDLPRDYNWGPDSDLEKIKTALSKKGYEADYDDAMDVS